MRRPWWAPPAGPVSRSLVTDQPHGDDIQRIQIDHLPPSVDEASLRELFEEYGEVVGFERPVDEQTEVAGAYVLLRMADRDADEAIAALDGKKLGGQALRVKRA